VTHAVRGETTEMDLDAASLAAEMVAPQAGMMSVLNRGYATSDAVVAWEFLEIMGNAAGN
jgi:hypothetical protein